MGLMKQEFAAQSAVRYPHYYVNEPYHGCNSQGASAETGVEDDAEVLQVLHSQRLQIYDATLRLNDMDRRHQDSLAEGSTDVPTVPILRSMSNMSCASGVMDDSAAKLSFEQILRLLRSSVQGGFQKCIPRQKCASPVPYNSSAEGYQPMFYVSKEPKLSKADDCLEGIPVRYQGFTKSTVWFSKESPCWGLAARRMQHQSRMKQKGTGADVHSLASKAALFFHVFEGFSYVLIRRNSPDEEIVKSNMTNYIVEKAAKFVQIWPAPIRGDGAPGSAATKAPTHDALPSNDMQSLSTSINPNLMRLKLERQPSGLKRSFSRFSSSGNEQTAPLKRLASRKSSEINAANKFLLPSSEDHIENTGGFGFSDGNEASAFNLEEAFQCDHLLEEALLSGDEDYASGTSGESTLQDFIMEESDDGFGNSLDPNGMVLCDIIFKTFCDRMNQQQFSREYGRVQGLLFNTAFGKSLRTAMDNKDPRVSVEFMFPGEDTTFVSGRPIGKIIQRERTPGSNDFVTEWSDDYAKGILKLNPAGRSDVVDSMDKNDMSYIMSKYYLLEYFSPEKTHEFWFQRLLTRPDGTSVVIRAFCTTELGGRETRSSKTISLQDVTHLYNHILSLPPLDSLY